MPKGRPSKFNANAGYREHLGHHVKSSLENNTELLIRFLGYVPWADKVQSPPADGLYYRYEGQELLLPTKRGKIVGYVPDFHLWEANGKYHLWECKGLMNQRSKQRISLMAVHYPDIPLRVITAPELNALKAEALYAARRRGEKVLDIAGWE